MLDPIITLNDFKYTDQVSVVFRMERPTDITLESIIKMEKGLDHTGTCQFGIFIKQYKEEEKIGHFMLTQLPGCCGVVVIHNMYLNKDFRGGVLSNTIRNGKHKLCHILGYTCAIATTKMSDIPAVKNMFKSRYSIVDTFTNRRTNNLIGIGVKKL